jgi:hypothetical protein
MSGDLVWLVECLNLHDAERISRELEMADISFFLNNQNMAAIFPGAPGGVSGFGLGKVVVMVPADDLERAQEIVHRLSASED